MYAKVGIVDHAGEGEEVKGVHHQVVDLLRVLHAALGAEVVLGGHDAGFMVSAQQENVLGVLDLEAHQQHHHLHRVYPAVHVVPQEH